MLKIENIRIDNLTKDAVVDRTSPEVSFSLISDIPDTHLESAEITVCGHTLACGNQQVGICLPQLEWKPFTEYELSISAVDNHGQQATHTAQRGSKPRPKKR